MDINFSFCSLSCNDNNNEQLSKRTNGVVGTRTPTNIKQNPFPLFSFPYSFSDNKMQFMCPPTGHLLGSLVGKRLLSYLLTSKQLKRTNLTCQHPPRKCITLSESIYASIIASPSRIEGALN